MILEILFIVFYSLLLVTQFVYISNLLYLTYLSFRSKKDSKVKQITKNYPEVTVQLPIYNEKYVVRRLIKHACKIDWPKDKLKIQVLDDSTDDTKKIAQETVAEFRSKGIDIIHITRENREGYKAGALENGLKKTKSEFIAIFDADFLPDRNFLKNTIPHFKKNIALVQTRWTYLNRSYSFLTKLQSLILDGHFAIDQEVRSKNNFFLNFNGTAGVIRREAIIDAGGWQHDTLTEDLDLSYRMQLNGWKCIYLRDVESLSEIPVSVNALRRQQTRWARGSVECARKLIKNITKKNMPLLTKIQAIFHLTIYLNMVITFLVILSFPVVLYLTTKYPQFGYVSNLSLLLLFTSFIPGIYFASAQAHLNNKDFKKNLPATFMASILASGLMITIVDAVIQALFSKTRVFERTPKFGITKKNEKWMKKKYRIAISPLLKYEIFVIAYLIFTMILAIYVGHWLIFGYATIFLFGTSGIIGYTIKENFFLTK